MMNKTTSRAIFPAFAALALLLGGCGTQSTSSFGNAGEQHPEIDLAGARIGGPFTLTDQDGKPRSWADFKGKYRLVYFGYSYCPDVCPVDLQRIAQGYRLFAQQEPARAAKVQPIFITVDSERDTPEVLKNYVSAFDPHMLGLTGTLQQIAVVAKEFAVVYSKEKPEGSTEYLVSHSRTPYLFGPDGKPLVMLPIDDPSTQIVEGSPQDIAAVLRRWVK